MKTPTSLTITFHFNELDDEDQELRACIRVDLDDGAMPAHHAVDEFGDVFLLQAPRGARWPDEGAAHTR